MSKRIFDGKTINNVSVGFDIMMFDIGLIIAGAYGEPYISCCIEGNAFKLELRVLTCLFALVADNSISLIPLLNIAQERQAFSVATRKLSADCPKVLIALAGCVGIVGMLRFSGKLAFRVPSFCMEA